MSKVGTQHAAMTCNPVQYLTHFGEAYTLLEQYLVLAEKDVYVYVSGQGPGQLQLPIYSTS